MMMKLWMIQQKGVVWISNILKLLKIKDKNISPLFHILTP